MEKRSYSRINTYESCPFKYKLRYVDGHYVKSNSIATEFGTLVHETEEAIAKAIKANEPIDYVKLKNNFILKINELEHTYKADFYLPDKSNRTYQEKAYYYLKEMIYNLENFMKAHPTYEIVGIEQYFEVNYENDYVFNGYIDRAFLDKETGNVIIQDIKTYAVPVEDDQLKTPLQFVIYTLAAKELYNVAEDQISCQYYLPLCNLTQNAGTNGYMNRGFKKLKKLFDGIANEDWTPAPSALCHWCEYCATNQNAENSSKFLCPYFSHWTRENRDNSTEFDWLGKENHEAVLSAYYKSLEK